MFSFRLSPWIPASLMLRMGLEHLRLVLSGLVLSGLVLASLLLSGCLTEVGPADRIGELPPGVPPPTAPPPPVTPPPGSLDAGLPRQDSKPQALPPKQPDADKDGVPNSFDKCSHTPAGKPVWKSGPWSGCAAGQLKDSDDGDRDGVPNGQDKCAKTPLGTQVYLTGNQAGCPVGSGPPPKTDGGTSPPPPGLSLSSQEKGLLDALNKARANNGLPPVTADAKLTCAARMHATDYSGGCDHTGSDGTWPWDRAKKCGFPQTQWTVNEICAGPGFKSGSEAVWGWQQSSGHWSAIIHKQAKLVGLGVGANGCFVALFDCCVASF